MTRPNECKWCGAGVGPEPLSLMFIRYECRSSFWIQANEWQRTAQCAHAAADQVEQLRDRIQRALDKIKASKRWSVEKIAKTPIEYYVDPDGWIAQGSDLDEVARILEGDADEQAR